MRLELATLLTALLVNFTSIVVVHSQALQPPAPLAPVSLLLNQLDAPLELMEYSARYKQGEREGQTGSIEHRVSYQNVGEQKVIAVEFVFLSYDIWNELFDRTVRTQVQNLNTGEERELNWRTPVEESFEGATFHTGVSYISRVRFENGEIWSVDVSEVAAVLVKVAPAISPSSL